MSTDCSDDHRFDDHIEDLAFECELTLPQARQVAELGLNAADPNVHHETLASLADPTVANAYFEAFFGAFPALAPRMLEAQVGRALAAGHDNAGVHLAAAHVAECRGDIAAWIGNLDTALRRDHAFPPARVDRGYAAWLQGDHATARLVLDGVDHPKAVAMSIALGLLEPVRVRMPRNRRCPCGSGAKSKHCCDGTIRLHGAHARLLWMRLEMWLHRFPQDLAFARIVAELADDDSEDDEALADIRFEGATDSIALLDAGLVDRFVSTIGHVLPDDDLALLDQWRGVRHRVWEIRRVDTGRHAEFVDIVDGTVRRIHDDGRSCCILPGELIYGAILPMGTGDGWFMPHHLPLEADQADEVEGRIRWGDDPMSTAARLYTEVRDAQG